MREEDESDSSGAQRPSDVSEVAAAAKFVRGEGRRMIRASRGDIEPELAPYAALLAMLATVFFVQGIVGDPADGIRVALTALLAATTVLSLHVCHPRPGVLPAGIVIGAGLVLLTLVQALTGGVDDTTIALADAFLVTIAPLAILIGVIRRLTAVRAVTVEAVIGVLAVYLLIGMAFAFVYGAIDHISSEPFFNETATATASQCQYFSFTTLATVGYGDYTAKANLGHTLANFEAVLGQVYLVTVVALIVSNLGRRRRSGAQGAPRASEEADATPGAG